MGRGGRHSYSDQNRSYLNHFAVVDCLQSTAHDFVFVVVVLVSKQTLSTIPKKMQIVISGFLEKEGPEDSRKKDFY